MKFCLFFLAFVSSFLNAHAETCEDRGFDGGRKPRGETYVLFDRPTEYYITGDLSDYGKKVSFNTSQKGFIGEDKYNEVHGFSVDATKDVVFDGEYGGVYQRSGPAWVLAIDQSSGAAFCKNIYVLRGPSVSNFTAFMPERSFDSDSEKLIVYVDFEVDGFSVVALGGEGTITLSLGGSRSSVAVFNAADLYRSVLDGDQKLRGRTTLEISALSGSFDARLKLNDGKYDTSVELGRFVFEWPPGLERPKPCTDERGCRAEP